MTKEEVINILKNIDPQCQKDCPISRDDCAKQENKCLVSEALEYAADFLSADVVEVKHGKWRGKKSSFNNIYYLCSLCGGDSPFKANFCPNCGADMGERRETNG